MRIHGDALSWTLCVRERREADLRMEERSNPLSPAWRFAEVCDDQANKELLNLAWRIYFEGTT